MRCSFAVRNTLLMRETRGEWPNCLKLARTTQTTPLYNHFKHKSISKPVRFTLLPVMNRNQRLQGAQAHRKWTFKTQLKAVWPLSFDLINKTLLHTELPLTGCFLFIYLFSIILANSAVSESRHGDGICFHFWLLPHYWLMYLAVHTQYLVFSSVVFIKNQHLTQSDANYFARVSDTI